MTRLILWFFIAVTVVAISFFAFQRAPATSTNSVVKLRNDLINSTLAQSNQPQNTNSGHTNITIANQDIFIPAPPPTAQATLPISGFYNRITKKPFGIYITPKTSPVQPERFRGYHTGADAETAAAEKDVDIPIYAVAEGKVALARYVSGYGGAVMIQHTVNGKEYSTLYGHLRLSSIKLKIGATVTQGQRLGVLGTGYTAETDSERKHLHFAVLPGFSTNVRGYVSTKSQLSGWLDPVPWLQALNAAEPAT